MKRLLVPWLAVAVLASASPVLADTFASGSLIVPMDTVYQDSGMLKAYGLVYALLTHGVPVRWVILSGKSIGQADFTVTAMDHRTHAAIPVHGYRGGPFVIDAADAAAAIPYIDAWQTANPSTTVHEATASFTGNVKRVLVAAPNLAVFADGNQTITASYLNAAGIPDSEGNAWPVTSPDLLTPTQVAGPTITNHADGALFDADGDPEYCQFITVHWPTTSAQAMPEVVAETRAFLANPVHFFAECQSVDAFEDLVPYGHFLTPNGFLVKAQPASVDYFHVDVTFAQIDGAFGTVGGSEPAYALPAGDTYKAAGVTLLTAHGFTEGAYDVWMNGYLDGTCPPTAASCGTLGKVSYLGGHQFTTTLPISTNTKTQGIRLFLNSLFDAPCSSLDGQPQISLSCSAPAATSSSTVVVTVNYSNAGPTVARGAVASIAVPPGATFVSATNGGTFAAGAVTWPLGNLGVGEGGAVSYTMTLGALGTYENTAQLSYKVGLTPDGLTSNTTSTIFQPLIGTVPDRQALGTPLTIGKNAGTPGHIDLAWGDGCGPGPTDFAVYEGSIGSWYSHAAKLCSTGGALAANDLTPAAGNRYYLVVPLSPDVEGSYGKRSAGADIPQGTGACRALWNPADCP